MAKTPVTLTVDSYKEREVLSVQYEFEQATDLQGQCVGIPRGGFITIKVKALNDGAPDLLDWMVDPRKLKSGTIFFKETKSGQKMKDIKFTDAYCVGYEEMWEEAVGHFEEIVIACKKIEFGNISYENEWA